MITAKYLRSILDYDAPTGIFRWKYRADQMDRVNKRFAGKITGAGKPTRYGHIRIDDQLYRAHRLAWLWMTGEWPKDEIDHKDLDRGNNRWDNLREATGTQNAVNQGKRTDNTSGFKGVCHRPQRRGQWTAQIKIGPKIRYIGIYNCPVAAHLAYVVEANKAYGEFARAA